MTALDAQRRYRARHSRTPLYLFRNHRANARARGIPFLLTFEEWTALWSESGKWEQRGTKRGQYCMARFGDQGAYEIGNVSICLNEENRSDRNRNYPMAGESNPAFGKDYWAVADDEERERRRATLSAAAKGKPKSENMRSRLSATATGRKRVIRNGHVTWAYPGDCDYRT